MMANGGEVVQIQKFLISTLDGNPRMPGISRKRQYFENGR